MAKNLEQRVAELEKKIREMSGETSVKLCKKLGVGDTFELIGIEWKILDITDKGYACLAERLEDNRVFNSDSNDWRNSSLRRYLYENIYVKLANAIGEENIIPIERDLLSLDGQTEYGTCYDKVSLLTVDEYRKYRRLIPNADYWWWLITPWSTPCNDYHTSVFVVLPPGYVSIDYCRCSFGVRPFCIFSSAIFESEE